MCSRESNFFGDQNIELIAIISSRPPIVSFDRIVVILDELLSMELVRYVHDLSLAPNNVWMVLIDWAQF